MTQYLYPAKPKGYRQSMALEPKGFCNTQYSGAVVGADRVRIEIYTAPCADSRLRLFNDPRG